MELSFEKEHLEYYNQDIIAKAGILVLHDLVLNSQGDTPFDKLFLAKESLLDKSYGNPVLRNSLEYFLSGLAKKTNPEDIKKKQAEITRKLDAAKKETSEIAVKKIRDKSCVFVHSVNNQIKDMLFEASKTKKITICLTEHSPLFFGAKLSELLKNKKISTRLFPDSAIKEAVAGADICFFGADAIVKDKGAMAKTGSANAAEIAAGHAVPAYVCGHSLKYDTKHTHEKALLHRHNKESHDYKAIYEIIPGTLITGYISEYGVFRPGHAEREIGKFNPWRV